MCLHWLNYHRARFALDWSSRQCLPVAAVPLNLWWEGDQNRVSQLWNPLNHSIILIRSFPICAHFESVHENWGGRIVSDRWGLRFGKKRREGRAGCVCVCVCVCLCWGGGAGWCGQQPVYWARRPNTHPPQTHTHLHTKGSRQLAS